MSLSSNTNGMGRVADFVEFLAMVADQTKLKALVKEIKDAAEAGALKEALVVPAKEAKALRKQAQDDLAAAQALIDRVKSDASQIMRDAQSNAESIVSAAANTAASIVERAQFMATEADAVLVKTQENRVELNNRLTKLIAEFSVNADQVREVVEEAKAKIALADDAVAVADARKAELDAKLESIRAVAGQ